MKKLLILSALTFALFIFVGCGSGGDSEGKKSNPSNTETTDEEKDDEEMSDAEVRDTEITDTETNDEEVTIQCEDSEGRKYNEGDIISDKCLTTMCRDGGWAEDAVECYPCNAEIGDKMDWTCADGVRKVEWCKCVEDEEHGSIWDCIERADLNCSKE